MEYGKTLIDRVARETGSSRYGICGEIDLDESFMSKIYNGKKPMPALIAAKLAMMIGLDPKEAALMALVEAETNPMERTQYRSWFDLPEQDEGELQPHKIAVPAPAVGSISDDWRKR